MTKRKIGEVFALEGMKIQVHPRRYAGVRGCKDCLYCIYDIDANGNNLCKCERDEVSKEELDFVGTCQKVNEKDVFTKFVIVGPADGTEVECYQKNTVA